MIDEKELLYGAATTDNQVKFAFGSGDEKFAVAAGQANGVLSFVAGSNGGAVYVGSSLVSSKVLSYAVSTDEITGEQVVDVRYIDTNNAVATAQVKAVNASFVEGKVGALKTAVDASIAKLTSDLDNVKNIAEGQSYTLHQITPTEANVKEEYQLFVGDQAVSDSSTIKIYKDSALKSAELQVVDGKDTLVLTYINSEGVDTSVGIDVADFLRESEFKNGLKVENGQVSVKIDATSESYLTVGEDGVKLAGVADAIAAGDSSIKTYVDGLFTDSDAVIADVSADLAAHIAAYTQKMTAVDSSVLENAQAIDAIEAQIDGFNYVETSVFEDFVADLSTAQAAQDASINANAAAITELSEKVDALDASYVSEDELNTYKGEVSTAISNAITTEDSSIKTYVDGLIATVDASIDALQAADEAFTTKIGEVDSSIDALQAKNVEIDSSIDALQAKDVEIDSSIDSLQTADEALAADISANTAAIAENSSAINAINTTLTWTVLA